MECDLRDARWVEFASNATLFQSPSWCGMVADFYGFDARVLVAERNDRIIGGLPFAQVNDFRGARRVTFPFSDVCDAINPELWPALEGAIVQSTIPWTVRTRSGGGDLRGVEATSPGMYQVIPLPATFQEAAARFHQKQNVNARRLERAGGVCRRVEDLTALDKFYDLFSELRRDKFRLLPQGRDFFARVMETFFPDRGFALFAELDGRVVMGMILISHGDTLYVKYSAMDRRAADLRPSNYLFAKAIEEAIRSGHRVLDLGISGEEGLIRFKRHLGAEAQPYYQLRYNSQAKTDAVKEVEGALGAMTRILTESDVPLSAVQQAGSVLYRFFV